jgi:hypothetical protein
MLPKEYSGWHVWKKLSKKQQEEICDSKAKVDVVLGMLSIKEVNQKVLTELLMPVAKTFAKLLIE